MMPRQFAPLAATLLVLLFLSQSALAAEFTVEETPGGKAVKIDGQPFTEYLTKSGSKPILWPIYGPTGKQMTRTWPLETDVPGETDRDHIHQRSLWFTHGDVNGIDFWSEGKGRIEHREFVKAEGGDEAVIVTRNDWLSPDGSKLICQDQRTLHVRRRRRPALDRRRHRDQGHGRPGRLWRHEGGLVRRARGFEHARAAGPEGSATSSTAKGKPTSQPGASPPPGSTTTGPVEDETLGIAILNHPSSFRFPTYWHVRTYGLFAANPFGLNDFTSGKSNGEYTLPEGETLTLRYRVLLHKGDEKAGRVAETFEAYAK